MRATTLGIEKLSNPLLEMASANEAVTPMIIAEIINWKLREW